MERHQILLFFISCFLVYTDGLEVKIPELTFEALSPKGLRVSIPASSDVKLFGFHGKLNEPIIEPEPGDFQGDAIRPVNGRLVYLNPTLELKNGDKIYYWVFIQVQQYGFRKKSEWVVGESSPVDKETRTCITKSKIVVNGATNACVGDVVLNAMFTTSSIDTKIWLIEQYYPDRPDFEFVIYKNDPDVLILTNNLLTIKPKLDENVVRREEVTIDGCTRQNENECLRRSFGIYQHPIISARISTLQTFSFGKYEVRVKFPRGDWLYPELFLEDVQRPERRIYLGYSRGNAALTGNAGDDLGSKLLFGGPSIKMTEPVRSENLSSKLTNQPIGTEMHKFTLDWTPDRINLYFDDAHYGSQDSTVLERTGFNIPSQMRLVIGLGAGGNNFPDGYQSGQFVKPWLSHSRDAVKKFFNNRTSWLSTWIDGGQLQVEHVKITAN